MLNGPPSALDVAGSACPSGQRRAPGLGSQRPSCSNCTASRDNAAVSERNVAMLLGRIGVALVLEHVERGDQLLARVARLDHLVDVAAAGGDVGIGKRLLIVRDQLLALGLWVGGPLDLVFEEDVDGA